MFRVYREFMAFSGKFAPGKKYAPKTVFLASHTYDFYPEHPEHHEQY